MKKCIWLLFFSLAITFSGCSKEDEEESEILMRKEFEEVFSKPFSLPSKYKDFIGCWIDSDALHSDETGFRSFYQFYGNGTGVYSWREQPLMQNKHGESDRSLEYRIVGDCVYIIKERPGSKYKYWERLKYRIDGVNSSELRWTEFDFWKQDWDRWEKSLKRIEKIPVMNYYYYNER